MTWTQISCAVFAQQGVEPICFPWAELRDEISGLGTQGGLRRFWFVRKPPGVRLRFETADDGASLVARLVPWLAEAEARNQVRSFRLTTYEAEEHKFGGSVGMELAHGLLDAHARAAVAVLAEDAAPEHRAVLWRGALGALLDGALADDDERWDVWSQILAALPDGPEASGRDRPWHLPDRSDDGDHPEIREIGVRLRACADAGVLTAGPRAWCRSAAFFLSNQMGLPYWDDLFVATVRSMAVRP